MNVYYHKTSGGAEYLSTTYVECPSGHKEGTSEGIFARVDGGEFELFTRRLKDIGFNRVKVGDTTITLP